MISQHSKILITGANGLVGSALFEELRNQNYPNLIPLTRSECDLTDFKAVKEVFTSYRPDVVFHLAAAVHGIGGNLKNPASIFLNNILMNTHVIEACHNIGAQKIIAMGTIAAYPEPNHLPIKEEQIWEGAPHSSEASYGHAKRAMLAQLTAYHTNYGLDFSYPISTNLFGPNDKFDIQYGHVIPSLIRKFYEAKKNNSDVVIWGDGSAARDFLYSKDIARALVLIMNKYTGPINVASGKKTLIKEVASILSDYFEMDGKVKWDAQKPNGRTFYENDLTRLQSIGFEPLYTMDESLKETASWFANRYEQQLVRC